MVTHAAYPRGDHPLEHLINQAVLHAVEAAADESRLPHQITEMGLSPWQVKKVFGGPTQDKHDVVLLRGAELVPRLSESLAELTQMPRAILNEPLASVESETAFRLYFDRVPQKAGTRDFFAGIVLASGGEARRKAVVTDPGAAEDRRQLAVRTRNLRLWWHSHSATVEAELSWLGPSEAWFTVYKVRSRDACCTAWHKITFNRASGHWRRKR